MTALVASDERAAATISRIRHHDVEIFEMRRIPEGRRFEHHIFVASRIDDELVAFLENRVRDAGR